MANYVTTILMFDDVLKDKILNRDGFVDFNILVPMPPNIYTGSVGIEELKKYGEDNWYDWRNKYWGTKSNAEDQKIVSSHGVNYAQFDTAWSAPINWLNKLAKYGNFIFAYADEDLGHNCGIIEVVDNSIMSMKSDRRGLTEDEARVLACWIKDYDSYEMLEMFEGINGIEDVANRYDEILNNILPDGFKPFFSE
jgi:hypothetical protein